MRQKHNWVKVEYLKSRDALWKYIIDRNSHSFKDRADFDRWLDSSLICSAHQEFFLFVPRSGDAMAELYIEIQEPWVPMAVALQNMNPSLEDQEAAALARQVLDKRNSESYPLTEDDRDKDGQRGTVAGLPEGRGEEPLGQQGGVQFMARHPMLGLVWHEMFNGQLLKIRMPINKSRFRPQRGLRVPTLDSLSPVLPSRPTHHAPRGNSPDGKGKRQGV